MTLRTLVRVFGACDLLNVAFYAYRQTILRRVPLFDDLRATHALGAKMPELFPPPFLVGLLGALFLLSLIVSGVLLLRGARAGGWLSIAQVPFRPITWWSASPLLSLSGSLFPLVVAVEFLKSMAVGLWLWKDRSTSEPPEE